MHPFPHSTSPPFSSLLSPLPSGCVEAILASLEANPEFPEHVLGQALSILDRLCDHKKSLHILVERESIRALIALLQRGNQKTEVLVSCLKGMSKLTRGE
jgi:hypothetical protein